MVPDLFNLAADSRRGELGANYEGYCARVCVGWIAFVRGEGSEGRAFVKQQPPTDEPEKQQPPTDEPEKQQPPTDEPEGGDAGDTGVKVLDEEVLKRPQEAGGLGAASGSAERPIEVSPETPPTKAARVSPALASVPVIAEPKFLDDDMPDDSMFS